MLGAFGCDREATLIEPLSQRRWWVSWGSIGSPLVEAVLACDA
jgi:hypothetical protein